MAQNYKFSCIYANFSLILRHESENNSSFIPSKSLHDDDVRDQMGSCEPSERDSYRLGRSALREPHLA